MPLYVADYLRDTRRLTAAEHGAYLLLIMEYWTSGSLPDDDRQLARITCMSAAEWRRSRPNVQAFFHDGWTHKRIDAELAKSADISSKRAASAKLKHSKSSANAEQMDTHAGATSQSQSQLQSEQKDSEPIGSGALAPIDDRTRLFRDGLQTIARLTGKGPDACRSFVGKCLKAAGDDAVTVLGLIEDAERNQVVDASAWIAARLKGTGPHGKPLTQHQLERENSRRILDDLDKFANGGSGSKADPGLLRLNSGDGSASIYGGVRGATDDLSPRGPAKGD
jgi:uncharacterized protein YdaU (DUF1376 family)